ncbi:hypothetical protein NUM_54420 [Actinocatenispora comari]|uniref:Uncharacterized protein n=1 Tax=Actinocatenispora comari TaxID=2807577 RepID=A0A8J4ENV1_9ACTN|nr:hypothetical protein NUM_54420 [Actinocatenispora comari]
MNWLVGNVVGPLAAEATVDVVAVRAAPASSTAPVAASATSLLRNAMTEPLVAEPKWGSHGISRWM